MLLLGQSVQFTVPNAEKVGYILSQASIKSDRDGDVRAVCMQRALKNVSQQEILLSTAAAPSVKAEWIYMDSMPLPPQGVAQ